VGESFHGRKNEIRIVGDRVSYLEMGPTHVDFGANKKGRMGILPLRVLNDT